MKGVVFTEFLEMVEQQFDYTMVDNILNATHLPSGGIYTSVGKYNPIEMVTLLSNLTQKTNISLTDVLRSFGKHLFKSFIKTYHYSINKAPDFFSFLNLTHDYIKIDVRKLYPEAELPNFEVENINEKTLVMYSYANRKIVDFAYGLIEGSLEHYGECAIISMESLNEDGSWAKFVIEKQ